MPLLVSLLRTSEPKIFLFGAQRAMFDEMVFVSNELLDRARTETHLLAEFASLDALACRGRRSRHRHFALTGRLKVGDPDLALF